MSRRTAVWIAGWVAAVVLIEGAAFILDRHQPDLDLGGMVYDSYVGDPIRFLSLHVSNQGGRPIEVRSVTVEWLGSKREVTLSRTIAAGESAAIEDAVAAELERPAEPGTYPIAITAIDAAFEPPGGADPAPRLSPMPLRTTLAVMSDGGPGDGFRDFLAAARVCAAAPSPSGALASLPEPERESFREGLGQASDCLALARSAAHAPQFTVPAPRRYSAPADAYPAWLNAGHWLVLAGAAAEWRGELDAAWASYLDALLLALRLDAATWRHGSVEAIFAPRAGGPPRRELVRLLGGGRAPPPALGRPYLDTFRPLLAELERATSPEGLAVDQPDDVLRPLRYSPLAPLLALPIRGMTLASQTAIVEKRFAHLVRTKALVRRLEIAASGPGASLGAYSSP